MPRNGSGDYTLPGPNPYPALTNTVIASAAFNAMMSDVQSAITDSLSRSGLGGMLVPFLFADGTEGSPGAAWANEANTGFYRNAAGDLRASILGADMTRWLSGTGFQVSLDGGATWSSTLAAGIPTTLTGTGWNFTGGLTVTGGAAVDTLTIGGQPFVSGVLPAMSVANQGWRLVNSTGSAVAWTHGANSSLGTPVASFTDSSGTWVQFATLTKTFVNHLMDVLVELIPTSGGPGQLVTTQSGASSNTAEFRFKMDGSVITFSNMTIGNESALACALVYPPTVLRVVRLAVPAGAHTFTAEVEAGGTSVTIRNVVLQVSEY